MSVYEAAYKSLLQGVSQQLPQERLPGQLSSQVNMMSDPVTNLRRRPGLAYAKSFTWTDATDSNILSWFTDIAGQRVHVYLHCGTGEVRMFDETFTELTSPGTSPYLITSDLSKIRATSVGNEFFLANVANAPTLLYGSDTYDPARGGFFYVAAGAFGKEYNVAIQLGTLGTINASYTTPSGSSPGDAAQSTPEYIANQLVLAMPGTSAVTAIDFRSITIDSLGAGEYLKLQKLSGGVWVDVTYPSGGITVGQLSTAQIRVAYKCRTTAFRFTFRHFNPSAGVYSTDCVTSDLRAISDDPTVEKYMDINEGIVTSQVSGPNSFALELIGPYIWVQHSAGIVVSTTLGTNYGIASKANTVIDTGKLPARLPNGADGFICKVGTADSPQYYRYRSVTQDWIEVGAYNSASGLVNMPVGIFFNETDSLFHLRDIPYEGCNAGDADSNEVHEFMKFGITGMGTHQGRLVLMSGPLVSLSGSNKPRRFFRTTVTSLIASDPIEIGSGANSSAAYEWAVPFNKDLLLFSRAYQAVLPSGNSVTTPSNATVVPTSGYESDMNCSPVVIGRTLMYPNPRSTDFFGMLEMVPSSTTDSQYTSQDATPHLPKYLGGRCRFIVSSGVSSMALVAPTGDSSSLIVHEYHWDGDNKVQQAWHQWLFPYPVARAYFASDKIIVMFVKNNTVVCATMDPRAGATDSEGLRRPFLDLNVPVTIVDHSVTVPAWMLTFDPTIGNDLTLIANTGELTGEKIGATYNDSGVLITVLSWPSGSASLGLSYHSGVIPGPPNITDYNQQIIHSGKATLLRYNIGTKNSSEFQVIVTDAYTEGEDLVEPTIAFDSPELDLGRGLFSNQFMVLVPCRTDLRTTAMEVFTEDTGELNITSLEYVAKFHPKIKRR